MTFQFLSQKQKELASKLSKHKSQQLEWPGKSILNMREIEKIQKTTNLIGAAAAEVPKKKPPPG